MFWFMFTGGFLPEAFKEFNQYIFKVYDDIYVVRIDIYRDNADAAKLFNLALIFDYYLEEIDMDVDYWQEWVNDNFLEDGLDYLSSLLSPNSP